MEKKDFGNFKKTEGSYHIDVVKFIRSQIYKVNLKGHVTVAVSHKLAAFTQTRSYQTKEFYPHLIVW